MNGHAVALRNTGELLKIYSGGGMKYYKQEMEPLIELYTFRQKQNDQYLSSETALNSKKDRLFSKGDMACWEYEGPLNELIGRSHQLLRDKNLAYPFMCTKETKKVQEAKERVNEVDNFEEAIDAHRLRLGTMFEEKRDGMGGGGDGAVLIQL